MNDFINFKSVSQDADILKEATLKNGTGLINLGISYFDDAFRGITKTDIVLLGAGSGAGKSEAAFHIAFHNANIGKKVLLFALEAEKKEVELRQLYKIISKMFFDDRDKKVGKFINYTDFYYGRLWDSLDKYYSDAVKELKKSSNLFIRYSPTDFTLDDFIIEIESNDDADLIVLDHFHYLALGDEPENTAFKKAIKKIREVVLEKEIPIILVAQLRKDYIGANGSIMPDLADFHGSSDLYKIATKGIMFASGEKVTDQTSDAVYRRPTIMKAVKNRIDGSVKTAVGLMAYDYRTNSYDDKYLIGKLEWVKDENTKRNKEQFVSDVDIPRWASNAKF